MIYTKREYNHKYLHLIIWVTPDYVHLKVKVKTVFKKSIRKVMKVGSHKVRCEEPQLSSSSRNIHEDYFGNNI